jgi:phosphoglycolate phosphatase-like HAD superfamily hydrolase
MAKQAPDVLAFDFDGVICDGLWEYFQTAWRAYCQLYDLSPQPPPEGLAERFYPLRPVIETGWEMPVMLRAMMMGASDAEILAQWPAMALPYLEACHLTPKAAAQAVDTVRDTWINTDLEAWLALHRFYPPLLAVLRSAIGTLPTYIISTKEGRFIQQLLHQNGIDIDPGFILGKEKKQPKYETLRQLLEQYSVPDQPAHIWFFEDRIKALQAVKAQPDLETVTLFLADWGYNLESDRELARQDSQIHLLSLEAIVQEYFQWL